MNDMPSVHKKFMETNVQRLVEQYNLTELETKCIIMYTLISKQRDTEGQLPYHQNLFFLFCKAYRERDDGALLQFADYSFHFWNGLAKLPKAKLTEEAPFLFRGLNKRLEVMNDLYVEGNTVHWHYPSSSSTDSNVSQEFANGGTLFRFDGITDARSIEPFSLAPTQKEFLLPFTSVFKVVVALSCDQARLVESFIDKKTLVVNDKIATLPPNSPNSEPALPGLPPNVDLVVLKCYSTPLTTSTNQRAPQRLLQRQMSLATCLNLLSQGAGVLEPQAQSDASLQATTKSPLPAFLKQVSPDTPRAIRRQAFKSAASIERSLLHTSAKRFDEAQRAGQRGSFQSPRILADDVRVEVVDDQASRQGQATYASGGNELNGVAVKPTALGEGTGRVPAAHAAGTDGVCSRPFLRQQVLRPRATDTASEIMYSTDPAAQLRLHICTASEIEPAWNENVAL
jgi:hypothetical protein